MTCRRIAFLQLPLLDNDASGIRENLPMAAFYLRYAVQRSGESRHWKIFIANFRTLEKSDAELLRWLRELRPDVLALTLYLWNIERSLHVARRYKELFPQGKVVVGGPEVSPDHPFLFEEPSVDVAVVGEGESVFPAVLKALRSGTCADFCNVAHRCDSSFVWGRCEPPPVELSVSLPPPADPMWRPNPYGVAYLEATRGCPYRCTFCCYGQRRQRISVLPAEEVALRTQVLISHGARFIRFVDPTFSTHPDFERILERIAEINRGRRVELFAELRAEMLSARQAELLAEAGFREIEVGMQSRSPATLRAIGRPTYLPALDRGMRRLRRARIRVTVDLMYGLPRQTLSDVRKMLRWARAQRGIRIQCMPTLALPGTALRMQSQKWGLTVADEPPYLVRETNQLSSKDMLLIEQWFRTRFGVQWDCPTRQFVGRHLPDLFPRRMTTNLCRRARLQTRVYDRTAWIFTGGDYFERKEQLKALIGAAFEKEPHILWQIVLRPEYEEPLDLLEELTEVVRGYPLHILDRFIQMHSPGRIASRRILLWLWPGRRYERSWQEAVEDFLREHFY